MSQVQSEVRDGMRVDWDVPIAMDDSLVLRADVYRPVEGGRHPVILTYGPYAKGLAFQEGYPSAWERMAGQHPDVTAGSSNKYQSWEVVDPALVVGIGFSVYPKIRQLFRLEPKVLHPTFLGARLVGSARDDGIQIYTF